MTETCPQPRIRVAALYRFAPLPDFRDLRQPLAAFCCGRGIKGTLLLAPEGINGTVAGPPAAIAALIAKLEEMPTLAGIDVKYSDADTMPFHRMKVRLKREIVTMGVEGLDPLRGAGAYVEAGDWNALLAEPGVTVVDVRNDYEVRLGTFPGAVEPQTRSFTEFPSWAERNVDALRSGKVAMFCTGGIRCEKATAYVRSLGVDDVYHLKGGILKYLETVPAGDSRWSGECFVFDERVSVVDGLTPGTATLCRACRQPLMPQDRVSPKFREGISCERCFDERSDDDRLRYAERQHQVELAAERGLPLPIGAESGGLFVANAPDMPTFSDDRLT